MSEQKISVTTYQLNYQCDNCKAANLVPSGTTLEINPPIYVYNCPNCQVTVNLNKIYPSIIYV